MSQMVCVKYNLISHISRALMSKWIWHTDPYLTSL